MASSNDIFSSPPASVKDPLTNAFLSSRLPARHKVLQMLGLWCVFSSTLRFSRVYTGTETAEGAYEPQQLGGFAVLAVVGLLSSIVANIQWEEKQQQWVYGQLTTVALLIVTTCFGFLFSDVIERSDQPNPDVMMLVGAMSFASPYVCLLGARSTWLEACICGLVLVGPAVILQVISSGWLIMGYTFNCMMLYHVQRTLRDCFNSASKKHGQSVEAAFNAGLLAGMVSHQTMLNEGSSASSAGTGTGNGKRPRPEALVTDNFSIPSEEDCDAALDYMERFYAKYARPGCHDQLSEPPRLRQLLCDQESTLFIKNLLNRQLLCDQESASFVNNLLNSNLEFQTKDPLPREGSPQQKMETSETSALRNCWKVRASTMALLPPTHGQELNPVSFQLQNEPSQIDDMEYHTTDVPSENSSACKMSSSDATLSDDSQQDAADFSILSDTVPVWQEEQATCGDVEQGFDVVDVLAELLGMMDEDLATQLADY